MKQKKKKASKRIKDPLSQYLTQEEKAKLKRLKRLFDSMPNGTLIQCR